LRGFFRGDGNTPSPRDTPLKRGILPLGLNILDYKNYKPWVFRIFRILKEGGRYKGKRP